MTYIEQFPANFATRLGDPIENVIKWREQAQAGVPDKYKRSFILSYFKIDPAAAKNQYALIKNLAGVDFV